MSGKFSLLLFLDFGWMKGPRLVDRHTEFFGEAGQEACPCLNIVLGLGPGDGVPPVLCRPSEAACHEADALRVSVSYTHLTLPTTPYV